MRLRPHHLFCVQGFHGSGGDEYTENLRWIADKVWKEPFTPVEVVDGPDDVCAVCTYLRDGICCWEEVGEEKVRAHDAALFKALGISPGRVTSIAEVRRLLTVVPEATDEVRRQCATCPWVTDCAFINERT